MAMSNYRVSSLLFRCSIATLFCLAFASMTFAGPASVSAPAGKPAQAQPEDHLGRNSPYGTVSGFIQAAEKGNNELASRYLEGNQSAKKKEELARLLKEVLDRGTTLDLNELSRKPEGHLDDSLSQDLEDVGKVTYADESLTILLHRVPQKDAQPIWLFSSETLQGVPDAAEQLNLTLGERIWPESVRSLQFLSVPLFMWLNNLLLAPLVLGMAWLLTRGLRLVLRPVIRRWFNDHAEGAVAGITRPMLLLIFSLAVRIGGSLAGSLRARAIWVNAGTVLAIIAVTWLLVRMTKLVTEWKILRLRQAGLPSGIAAVELYSWLVVGLCVVAGSFLVMRSLGLDVTTAVAGLGVGGIAIAFAAQETIKNLFGTVSIIGDKAMRVGDRCQVGNIDGWVDAIGLRSTRIRTVNGSLVSIPNGQLAAMSIDNLELRDRFLFRHDIRLNAETTPQQLRQVLAAIQKMMAEHPNVEPATINVEFVGFGDSSFDLEVEAYVPVQQRSEFLKIQGILLFEIVDIIVANGTRRA